MFGWSRCSQSGSTVENMFDDVPLKLRVLERPTWNLKASLKAAWRCETVPKGATRRTGTTAAIFVQRLRSRFLSHCG